MHAISSFVKWRPLLQPVNILSVSQSTNQSTSKFCYINQISVIVIWILHLVA